jgi:hypothetical protein
MYGNRFYTDDIIRIYVGELIKDKEGVLWLVYGMGRNGIYNFVNLKTGIHEGLEWKDFKAIYFPVERSGKVNGIDLLESEDWLCHDKRCYPKILAGGCTGCMYSGLGKTRKRYFEPGDIVWVPSEKKERKVIESALFYRDLDEKNSDYTQFYSIRRDGGWKNIKWIVGFRLEKYPVSNKWYNWNEIRLVKRERHFINPTQLDHICNDLCLYGPYSKTAGIRCWECETGKIWRQIQC